MSHHPVRALSIAPHLERLDESAIPVLVVDDEETIRLAIAHFLRSRGYEVHVASSGSDALELLERRHFVVMLCDVRMPGMSGLEVVRHALGIDRDLAIMMLTAVNDAPTATTALSTGAYDYIMKPVELADLHRAIERSLHRRARRIEQREVEQRIRAEVAQRTMELEREQAALRALSVSIVETLINAMEAKDVYLRGHSQRVSELAAALARALGLDAEMVERVRIAGRLHDVGKIGTREDVLNKPGALTPAEFAHIQDHVRIGMEILAPLTHLGVVLDFVHDHHERWDGRGYPRGRAGEAISLGGRILTAADVYDALTSKRAYRDSMSPAATIRIIEEDVGLLEPGIFEVLRAVVLG
ncbi:MAG TPA: HD domain-containing phosphohydrolase [Gemmatimonadaceae bacterium]|nr:HD domain-containing phosphohydrolase [Gemmatimonadaceae bacterium]